MNPRLRALAELVPPGRDVVDVGADHGILAAHLGVLATERQPHRAGRGAVPWVVCDGLAGLRSVDVAVIAGMGARTILGILDRGPRPALLVAHAQDEPDLLRQGLAARGWRLDAESLAPEGRGYAELVRALPGEELATGLHLAFGPRLLQGTHPLRAAWLDHQRARWQRIADDTATASPSVSEAARARVAFLVSVSGERPSGVVG